MGKESLYAVWLEWITLLCLYVYLYCLVVFVVCKLGNDSQKAVQLLEKISGQEIEQITVKDVIGGLMAWANKIEPSFPQYWLSLIICINVMNESNKVEMILQNWCIFISFYYWCEYLWHLTTPVFLLFKVYLDVCNIIKLIYFYNSYSYSAPLILY